MIYQRKVFDLVNKSNVLMEGQKCKVYRVWTVKEHPTWPRKEPNLSKCCPSNPHSRELREFRIGDQAQKQFTELGSISES